MIFPARGFLTLRDIGDRVSINFIAHDMARSFLPEGSRDLIADRFDKIGDQGAAVRADEYIDRHPWNESQNNAARAT